MRDAPTHLVAEAIRSGGLANIKAVRIQDALLTLTEEQLKEGGIKTLSDYLYDKLTQYTSEEGWQYLRNIPGVGPKTAACVLMFNLNLPVMPVDTRVEGSITIYLYIKARSRREVGFCGCTIAIKASNIAVVSDSGGLSEHSYFKSQKSILDVCTGNCRLSTVRGAKAGRDGTPLALAALRILATRSA